MLKLRAKQLSLYSILYDKIPYNHILKMIAQAVDFSFINKLLEESYSKNLGRPAKEPEMMTNPVHVLKHSWIFVFQMVSNFQLLENNQYIPEYPLFHYNT